MSGGAHLRALISRRRPGSADRGAVARLARRTSTAVACTLVLTALSGCDAGPVELEGDAPAERHRAACRAFLVELPDSLADLPRRDVEPADGWGAAYGEPAIVVSCGSRPADGFTRTSACTTVNGVDWFVPQELLDAAEPVDLELTTVNREPFVRVELPAEHFPPAATLADLSRPVKEHLTRTGRCR